MIGAVELDIGSGGECTTLTTIATTYTGFHCLPAWRSVRTTGISAGERATGKGQGSSSNEQPHLRGCPAHRTLTLALGLTASC
jgi:hypothetical protein